MSSNATEMAKRGDDSGDERGGDSATLQLLPGQSGSPNGSNIANGAGADKEDEQDLNINTQSAASMRLSAGLLNATHAKFKFQKSMLLFTLFSLIPFMLWQSMYTWASKNLGSVQIFWALPIVFIAVCVIGSCGTPAGLNGYFGFDTVSDSSILAREAQLGAEWVLKNLDVFDDRMVRRQALPRWSGAIVVISYVCLVAVAVLGDTRLNSISYRCCGGLEATVQYEGCINPNTGINVPVGGLVNGVILVQICPPIQSAPFLMNLAPEQMPIALTVNFLFTSFYIVMLTISIVLVWETTEEIRRIMKHEERTIINKHGKMGNEWFNEINNIINNKVREKLSRSYGCGKGETSSAWMIGSTLCAVLASLWLPTYIMVYYGEWATGLDMFALVVAFAASVMCFSLLTLGLQFPYLMYYKSQMAMTILFYAPLDFQHLPHLQLWRRLRHFYTTYRMPVDHSLAQQAFGLFCFTGMFCILMVVVRIYTQGFSSFRSLPMFAITFVSLLCMIFSWVMMSQAVEVWDTQRSHIHLLKDTRFLVMISHNTHKRLKINTNNWMASMNDHENQDAKLAEMLKGKSPEEQEKIKKQMAAGINVGLGDGKKQVEESSSDSESSSSDSDARAKSLKKKKALLQRKKPGKKGKIESSDDESSEDDKKKKKGKKDAVKEIPSLPSVALSPEEQAKADAEAKLKKNANKGEHLKLTPVEVLEDLTETIELFDKPPEAFGLRMDNFLPHVLRGFFLICFVMVAGKYGIDSAQTSSN